MEFSEVAAFHGHVCPGLAMGFRVAQLAVRQLGSPRAGDEELVAVVENNSCAVDAIQVLAGCTFGKGNLIFLDHGKQVYTFFQRGGDNLRIAVVWEAPSEPDAVADAWRRFRRGERGGEVMRLVGESKAAKAKAILEADEEALFRLGPALLPLPEKAVVYPSVTCCRCGEKVMEPKTVPAGRDGARLCLPCARSSGSG